MTNKRHTNYDYK